MKKLYGYLKIFFKEEYNAGYFVFTLVFLAILIRINYKYDLENYLRLTYRGTCTYYAICAIYYSVPYIGSILAYSIFYQKKSFLSNKEFWITIATLIFTLTINEGFNWHRTYINENFPEVLQPYIRSCTTNAISFFLYLIPLFIYWLYYDKSKQVFYGFNAKFDAKPYFIMIGLMTMPIAWASFQPDFLAAYPAYLGKGIEPMLHLEKWQAIAIFETLYSLDFVSVEIVYRGFMILAIAKFMGRGAIIPMVTLYCVIHFGKPLGEAISSIFGGLILGVLTYETRSIWGGVIIHLGVALMMEIASMYQLGT